MITTRQCCVVVDFGVPGVPICRYRAALDAAEQFAAEATRQGLARVILNEQPTEGLDELPYQDLFQEKRKKTAGGYCACDE